ncbi:hypothetical protein BVG16_16500 [Paenibacillus selenitireducens]|uniref:Uncharacterized protein n=1 Tax=Paenibacillus selenitireducens TaxID=1324314 RepID=A0A1T2XA39_9BACL|nr:hypothetical protein BVG16_16500 [Paenibacillus selenitireducens]
MSVTMSLDVSGERLSVKLLPRLTLTPATLIINSQSGIVELSCDDEHLAEIESAIRQYRENIGPRNGRE